jgi:acyl carrier protein
VNATDRIRAFITDELMFGGGSRPIDDDAPLWEGAIDSVGLIELVGFLESEFGIDVEDRDLTADNFRSIGAIGRLVTSRSESPNPTTR